MISTWIHWVYEGKVRMVNLDKVSSIYYSAASGKDSAYLRVGQVAYLHGDEAEAAFVLIQKAMKTRYLDGDGEEVIQ